MRAVQGIDLNGCGRLRRLLVVVLLLSCCLAVGRFASAQEKVQETVPGLGIDTLFADNPLDQKAADKEAAKKPFWSDIQWSGYLKNETAYRYKQPRTVTKIRNIAYLNAQYPYSDKTLFNFSGWAYHDLAYDLFNYQTISGRTQRDADEPLVFVERLDQQKDSNVAQIRELYGDWHLDGLDLRIGKQYIIWGVLEGIRVVDELNPMDFRELILPELLDYRVSSWSLKADYFLRDSTVEFVFIPDLQFHKPAPRGSEWELLQDVCIGQAADIICVDKKPQSWNFNDAEYGLRWDGRVNDTELTLSYLYTYDEFATIFRSIPLDTTLFCSQSNPADAETCINPAFFPTYTRISMYGGTAVRQFGRYIVKSEMAFVQGKNFGVRNSADENHDGFVDHDGELKKDHVRWALGVEFNVAGFDIAPGITQWIILNHEKILLQDKFDTSLSLFVRKEFPAQSAVFQLLIIDLVNMKELLIKPKMTFQIDDRLQLGVGIDLFYGLQSDFGVQAAQDSGASTFDAGIARAQFIGNFHDNDRVYLEFKYSF